MLSIEEAVLDTIEKFTQQKTKQVGPVVRDKKLVQDLSLTSLDLAEIVVELEDLLNIWPFDEVSIVKVETVGDLIDLYEENGGE